MNFKDMNFKDILQIYRYRLIEMLMSNNDESFLDLLWKLCANECAEEEGGQTN